MLKSKSFLLLLSLLALLIGQAFFESFTAGKIILAVFMCAGLVATIYYVSDSPAHRYIGMALGIPWVFLVSISALGKAEPFMVVTILVAISLLVYTTSLLLKNIIRQSAVTSDTIFSAICVYLLIGICWTGFYILVQKVAPGSFVKGGQPASVLGRTDLLYYSYVTLTTLGYGDIVPANSATRLLAIFEAVTGVFYLAILVARLVGLYKR